MQDMRGRLPNKIVKKGQFKDKHFDGNMNFLYYEVDKVTEKEKTTVMTTINQSSDLMRILIGKQKNLSDEQLRKVTQYKDFLDRIMVLDPAKRMSFYDAFRTPFIMERMKWESNKGYSRTPIYRAPIYRNPDLPGG